MTPFHFQSSIQFDFNKWSRLKVRMYVSLKGENMINFMSHVLMHFLKWYVFHTYIIKYVHTLYIQENFFLMVLLRSYPPDGKISSSEVWICKIFKIIVNSFRRRGKLDIISLILDRVAFNLSCFSDFLYVTYFNMLESKPSKQKILNIIYNISEYLKSVSILFQIFYK